MRVFSEQFHRWTYIIGLCLLAAALPLSVYFISVALIALSVNWVLEGDFRNKWCIFKQRKSVWIVLLFYGVHVIGMTYSSDIQTGLFDLRIKLPMLAFPLIIGTSRTMNDKYLLWILYSFIGALLINSILSFYMYMQLNHLSFHFIALTTDFIDGIRLSLMVDLAIFIMFWLIPRSRRPYQWIYIPIIIWFIIFVFLLHKLTGIVVLILISVFLLLRTAYRSNVPWMRWSMLVSVAIILLITGLYFTNVYIQFFTFDKVNPATIEKSTRYGNPYWHNFDKKNVENGHYIYLYMCEPELRQEWNKRSHFKYDSLNRCNQALKYPLIRYLTSKGLHKDSEGVDQLTNKDILNIEWGMTNYRFENEYSIFPIVYTAIWELYHYHIGENPSGFSICQRIEAFKTSMHVIKKNFWLGVGTGDFDVAMKKQYAIDNSPLSYERRIGPHNQWITFFMSFGLIGFLIILGSLIIPVFLENKFSNYLFLLIFMVGFLSFCDEDTLKIHVGSSFFAFFYSLFLFWKRID